MKRFEIEQEFDNEPTYICDNAADADTGVREIVTIDPAYGTPSARKALAMVIVVTLTKMAESGEETKEYVGCGNRNPQPDNS